MTGEKRWFKVLPLIFTIILILILAAPAFAAVDALVVKCSDGSYHQYSYNDLLDSYALKLLGRSNGLYEDYSTNKTVALKSDMGQYIDYDEVINQYSYAVLLRQAFDLSAYITCSTAKPAELPPSMQVVTLTSGNLVRRQLTVDEVKSNKMVDESKAASVVGAATTENRAATPITGKASVSVTRAQQWAAERGAHQRFLDLAPLYWEYGRKTGIRPDVLYAQAAHETRFGHYGGQVPPEYNNWAGIKIAFSNGDKPEDHERFATPEDGVRGHFNHMAAYVGVTPVGTPHERYNIVSKIYWAGTVKSVEQLSGRWAPSSTYHEKILRMLSGMQ